MYKSSLLILAGFLLSGIGNANAQVPAASRQLWHGKERLVHYRPDGKDFVLVNGTKRFNRALYGTNTAFRVEAGDLPEFAMYMPGMGGNLQLGLVSGTSSKWIIQTKDIKSIYRPGSMLYEIKDPILGSGTLRVSVLALADAEGMIIKAALSGVSENVSLVWAFGGASGKKFSRNGDIGADPESSFYLKPENCKDNNYKLSGKSFQLSYASSQQLTGVLSDNGEIRLADASALESPSSLIKSTAGESPVVSGTIKIKSEEDTYILIQRPSDKGKIKPSDLASKFGQAEQARTTLAQRIQVNTPDPYINTLGGALAVAADGIWESPTFLHGAVAWRMRLNAWRGASVADPLGWHDRALEHFRSYAKSQVLEPERGPVVADTALNLARQEEKMGNAMFSSGYISRNPNDNTKPHHYDMNLVFFDQMMSHFQWTGDLSVAKEMWPVIKRHLDWEKRNFDTDGDGLYDAYCAIWASDALQYSGGGVTHTSSYNYRANKIAAQIARLIGEDSKPYEQEAEKIHKAINSTLWMPRKGWYAEYQDLLGLKKLHPVPGLWTIYHAIDSKVPDMFKAYQSLRYVDTKIPKIPILAKGLSEKDLYTLPTTNWQPYTWSVNNVALAEVLHTSLAYWQAGRSEEAFKLWKSNILESMYLSSSPGGFQQLSFYDAVRGELYRDFADPIGVAGRTLIEGLFGIEPNALADTLTIRPGLPSEWGYASLKTPDVSFDFKRTDVADQYIIEPYRTSPMNLKLEIKAKSDRVKNVRVNGVAVNWKVSERSLGTPSLEISAGKAAKYTIEVAWDGESFEKPSLTPALYKELFKAEFKNAKITNVYDPQQILQGAVFKNNNLEALIDAENGHKTFFLKMNQGNFAWWLPVDIEVMKTVELLAPAEQKDENLTFTVKNNGPAVRGELMLKGGSRIVSKIVELSAGGSEEIVVPKEYVSAGTNLMRVEYRPGIYAEKAIVNWNALPNSSANWEPVDLSGVFNDKVTNIFKNKYLSPRPVSPTLQLPTQGIGNWCYPLTTANIDDSGLREKAGDSGKIVLPNGIPMATSGQPDANNIAFTSQWDNYPDSIVVPLSGSASHAYLLMAGSTNPMQSRIENGEIQVVYTDGTVDRLPLVNPSNWWPIEQDYINDGYAFTTDSPIPYRVYLKSGQVSREFNDFITIKGFTNRGIDGGAATVLDLPLDPKKQLKELSIKTLANDVVIGLMSITLQKI